MANNVFDVNLLKIGDENSTTTIGSNYINIQDVSNSLFTMSVDVSSSLTTITTNLLFNNLPTVVDPTSGTITNLATDTYVLSLASNLSNFNTNSIFQFIEDYKSEEFKNAYFKYIDECFAPSEFQIKLQKLIK